MNRQQKGQLKCKATISHFNRLAELKLKNPDSDFTGALNCSIAWQTRQLTSFLTSQKLLLKGIGLLTFLLCHTKQGAGLQQLGSTAGPSLSSLRSLMGCWESQSLLQRPGALQLPCCRAWKCLSGRETCILPFVPRVKGVNSLLTPSEEFPLWILVWFFTPLLKGILLLPLQYSPCKNLYQLWSL